MRHLIVLFTAIAVLGSANSADALDVPFVDLAIGVRGGPSMSIISKVSEEDPEPVFPGFFGVGWAVGGGISVDYLDIVGLHIEFIYSSDSATGSVEFDEDLGDDSKKESSDFTFEVTQMHLPIYVRGSIPSGVARPFVHVGIDLVLNRGDHNFVVEQRGDAPAYDGVCEVGIECDPFPQRLFGADPVDTSFFVLVGLGLDIDVGPVSVPVEFRGLINPGYPDSVRERTTLSTSEPNFRYGDEFEYMIQILFGVDYRIL